MSPFLKHFKHNFRIGAVLDVFKVLTSNSNFKKTTKRTLTPKKEVIPGFHQFFTDEIQPLADILEYKRVKTLKKIRKRLFIVIPLGMLLVALAILDITRTHYFDFSLVEVSLFVSLGLVIFALYPSVAYKKNIKNKIIPKVLTFLGDFTYDASKGLNLHQLNDFEIIPYYQNAALEDYIMGTYEEVDIELCEANLTKTEGSGKNRRTVTVFNGLIIKLSTHKPFAGKTVIKRDYGKIAGWLSGKFNKLEPVKLEDPLFEKYFQVYSSDQVEARYLLTPSFMERLIELMDHFGGAKLQASFHDSSLLLTVPVPRSKNFFEIGSLFKPISIYKDVHELIGELSCVFNIIKILKLNQKTKL